MLLARLASIKRLRSDYQTAGGLYRRALAVLQAWAAGDVASGLPEREAWRAHWRARIQRMQGMLELHQGQPLRALEKLESSLEHFRSSGHWEELSQVCYA